MPAITDLLTMPQKITSGHGHRDDAGKFNIKKAPELSEALYIPYSIIYDLINYHCGSFQGNRDH